MGIPKHILNEIEFRVRNSWRTDHSENQLQEVMELEIKSYIDFQKIDYSDIPEVEKENILDSLDSKDEWSSKLDFVRKEISSYKAIHDIDLSSFPDDLKGFILGLIEGDFDYGVIDNWSSRLKEINSEITAFNKLKVYSPKDVPENLILEWKSMLDRASSYSSRYNDLKEKISKYRKHEKLRRELDPIKPLLIEIEEIIANECFNAHIQNYSYWGELESEGRSFRYPVTTYDGKKNNKRTHVPNSISSEELINGYYAFGANKLGIYRALYKVLKHLEEKYGFKIPKN